MTEENKPLKLDLGCGPRKCGPEWTGVDCRQFPGVDIVCNLVERHSGWEDWHDEHGVLLKNKSGYTGAIGATSPDLCGKFKPWPWEDNSVDEIFASHFLEHLTGEERVHFANEAYRVLKKDCKAVIICPHWASCRAYGDVTHKWPPVSEFWPFYLDAQWRAVNAPHNDGYTCDFTHGSGPGLAPEILSRNQEFQQFAARYYKEACQDIHIHLTKRV